MLEYNGKLYPDENSNRVVGVYTILGATGERTKWGHKLYAVKCNECGQIFVRVLSGVMRQQDKPCSHITNGGLLKLTAGNQYCFKNAKFSHCYSKIRGHCYNKADRDYSIYGMQGITICDDWLDHPAHFEDWCEKTYPYELAKKIGDDKLCLMRNYLGNGEKEVVYGPTTCHWETREEVARWKRNTNDIVWNGYICSGRQVSRSLGLGISTVNSALRDGVVDNNQANIETYVIRSRVLQGSRKTDGSVHPRAPKQTRNSKIRQSEKQEQIFEVIDSFNIDNLTLRLVNQIHTACRNVVGKCRAMIDACIKERFPEYNPDDYFLHKPLYPPYNTCIDLYNVWTQMISRCENPHNRDYRYYGKLGVRVCDEWRYDYRKFYDWSFAHGYNTEKRPNGAQWNILTIDRINPCGDYEPDNCRWATNAEQMKNRRPTK